MIYAKINSSNNITVRRCNIRGFIVGALVIGGSGHLVEDNRFDSNTNYAVDVETSGAVIRRNLISSTGGSTLFHDVSGILTAGLADIMDNIISKVVARTGSNGPAYGIYNSPSGRITLRDNDMVGDASAGSTGLLFTSLRARARNNSISGFANGIQGCNDVSGNDVDP